MTEEQTAQPLRTTDQNGVEFVRVKRVEDGTEYSIAAALPLGDDVEQIDKDSVSAEGVPLPPKYKVDLNPDRDQDVEQPDGEFVEDEPNDTWTVPQIEAYAAAQDPPIDLIGTTNKAEKLAAVTGS